MRSIKVFGLLAFAALLVGAPAASAEEFIASKAKIEGHALTLQKLTLGSHITVECEEASFGGEVTESRSFELKPTVKYGECFAVGIGKASVSEAKYVFFLPKLVNVSSKAITIKAEAFGVKCAASISVGQSVGGGAGELEYENKSGDLEVKTKITKVSGEITESNSESACGKTGEKLEGTYTGNDQVEVEGGSIETGSASGAEFEFSEAGTISGKALNTQKFKTGSPAEVECTGVSPSGSVEAGKLGGKSLALTTTYSGCDVNSLGGSTTVSSADYTLFGAPLLSVLKEISIEAGALGVECTILVISGQSLGSKSGEITYVQKGKNLELEFKVTKIESEITKSNSSLFCGTVGEKSTKGTYEGNDELELNGGSGTIKVS